MNTNTQTMTIPTATMPPSVCLPQNINLQELLQTAARLCAEKTAATLFVDFKKQFFNFIETERRPATAVIFKRAVLYLENFSEIKYLKDITPDLLSDFKQCLVRRGGSGAGANRYLRAVKTMMRWAERKKLVEAQDWNSVKYLRENKGRLRFYTEEEVKKILAVAKGGWKLVVLLGARAGLRRGEIANLKWADVDFINNQLFIAPHKTDKYRYVPMAADLRAALEAASNNGAGEYVINVGECGRDKPCWLGSFFRKILAAAGVSGAGCIHALRHTFASHLVQNGVDIYTVSKLLGHSRIKITEIYVHLYTKNMQSAVDRLPVI